VKARAVKKLDVDGPLADNLARIVAVRLDEVYDLAAKATHPEKVKAQHDMRIAVKRLRYVLELGDGCFGSYARTAIGRTKDLQDLLGEIHDCDVLLPRVVERLEALSEEDALSVLARADGAPDLDPALAARAPHAAARRGLVTLATHLRARRALLFDRFLTLWSRTTDADLRAHLLAAVQERPAVLTPSSHENDAEALEQTAT
jgi:CHAD domain-containing protein